MISGKLEFKMMSYFLLIAIAALMIGVEFYFELSSQSFKDAFSREVISGSQTKDVMLVSIEQNLSGLRNKIVTMFGVLSLVTAIVMLMFIKNVTTSLGKVIAISKAINSGDLSKYVEINEQDEIGELGFAINELTSNLQELALLTTTACERVEISVDEFRGKFRSDDEEEINTSILSLRNEMMVVHSFANMFTLLKTK